MDGARQATPLAVPGGAPMSDTASVFGFGGGAGPAEAHRRTPDFTGASPLIQDKSDAY
jgi:hypothetical protein